MLVPCQLIVRRSRSCIGVALRRSNRFDSQVTAIVLQRSILPCILQYSLWCRITVHPHPQCKLQTAYLGSAPVELMRTVL